MPTQETAVPDISDCEIESELLRLAAIRPHSFCPSEAARALAKDWRPLMPRIRRAAFALQSTEKLDILQKGRPTTRPVPGPIRLRLPRP
jgi:hypothetical protein